MNDEQVMHAMSIDDAYQVKQVFSHGPDGSTDLVVLDGSGPLVRKKISRASACRTVWAALNDCACPYLPSVWATYELPDYFVVVYGFIPGETLEQHFRTHGALAPEKASHLVGTLCEAAQALHQQGIIHRDISPANIIVAHDSAHLIDLGISQIAGAVDNTREETHMGTWGFAAPEQYGFAQTDARSDVYSLGCVLGYLLTGLSPDADGYDAALHDGTAVPESLAGVVTQACSFEPSKRFQSAKELASALRDAPHDTLSREEARPGRENRAQDAANGDGCLPPPAPHGRRSRARALRHRNASGADGRGSSPRGAPRAASP